MIREIVYARKSMQHHRLPPERLKALQETKLRTVVHHAYENVPYYAALFRSAGVSPGDIQHLEDLQRVPITTKDDLRAVSVQETVAAGIDLNACSVSKTSGTTGKPFQVYYTPAESRVRHLLGLRAHLAIGLRWYDRVCALGDHSPHRIPLHHRMGVYRVDHVSVVLPIEEQIQRLQQARPTILKAWTTPLRAILHQLDGRLSTVVQPRILITSAEACEEALRMQIQEDLPVEIFNFYSATEFGMIAAECRAHEGLHVHADHCILEYVREDGRPALPGELGIAVLTNLSGFAMPLIRYRLGDVGALRPECCSCGSSFPLIEHPLGRQDDMVRLPSGKILSALGLGMIVRDFGEMIVHYRFIQESVDRIVLQLVLRKGHCADTLSSIRRQVLAFLEDSIHLDIRVVDFIPEEARKFRKFVSKLND